MNFWEFADRHPVAIFFCVLSICWMVVNVAGYFRRHE